MLIDLTNHELILKQDISSWVDKPTTMFSWGTLKVYFLNFLSMFIFLIGIKKKQYIT